MTASDLNGVKAEEISSPVQISENIDREPQLEEVARTNVKSEDLDIAANETNVEGARKRTRDDETNDKEKEQACPSDPSPKHSKASGVKSKKQTPYQQSGVMTHHTPAQDYSPPNYMPYPATAGGGFMPPYPFHPMYHPYGPPPTQPPPSQGAPHISDPSTEKAKASKKSEGNIKGGSPTKGNAKDKTESVGEGQPQQPYGPPFHHNIMYPQMHPAMFGQAPYYNNRHYQGMPPAFGPGGFAPGAYGMPTAMPPIHQVQPPGPMRRGIRLSLACDVEQLSDYQIMVRQQLEIFEAGQEDVESNTQGRKKPVVLGQVGLRCRHCASLPLRARGRGAVYYPAKLHGIYQAAQNMAGSHLCQACQHIPSQIREQITKLRDRRDNASGGKQYWADGCRALGIYEADNGLKLGKPSMGAEEI